LLLFIAIYAGCIAIPSMAQDDIYDNGPTNGNIDAWTITAGFATSDSFTVGGPAAVNGLSFAAWLFPGDVLASADVLITSEEFGGTTYFDQTVNFVQSNCIANNNGFTVCSEAGSFSGPTLNSGTYWLTLSNAMVNDDDPVYWDENDGPSQASNDSVGTLPSESFTVLGAGTTTGSTSATGTTPEPSSILLLSSGVLAVGGLLKQKLL
jgi:hypothetical protein